MTHMGDEFSIQTDETIKSVPTWCNQSKRGFINCSACKNKQCPFDNHSPRWGYCSEQIK